MVGKCGAKWRFALRFCHIRKSSTICTMAQLLGEFDSRIDAKGRFNFPAGLRRQLPPEANDSFVVNRGFESCLVLYPRPVWDEVAARINQLNPFVKEHRAFTRYFFRGATELRLDNAQRLLLPKKLMEYAGIEKELVLFAHTNKIELWSADRYEHMLDEAPLDFATLAEKVMGPSNPSESL